MLSGVDKMIDRTKLKKAADIAWALSTANRLAVLDALKFDGGLTLEGIMRKTNLSKSKVIEALHVLTRPYINMISGATINGKNIYTLTHNGPTSDIITQITHIVNSGAK